MDAYVRVAIPLPAILCSALTSPLTLETLLLQLPLPSGTELTLECLEYNSIYIVYSIDYTIV